MLGVALWLAVVVPALPALQLGNLALCWNLSFWLTAILPVGAITLLRRAERRLFPPWL